VLGFMGGAAGGRAKEDSEGVPQVEKRAALGSKVGGGGRGGRLGIGQK